MLKGHHYIEHDSNSKDNPKIMKLLFDLGGEGYGIYWILLEILRSRQDFECPIALIPMFSKKYNIIEETTMKVIKEYDLFSFKENESVFFNSTLSKRTKAFQEKQKRLSENASKAGKASAEKRQEYMDRLTRRLVSHNTK